MQTKRINKMLKKTVRIVIIPTLEKTVYTMASNATIVMAVAKRFKLVAVNLVKTTLKNTGKHTPGVNKQSSS
jgi:hypothetical protein